MKRIYYIIPFLALVILFTSCNEKKEVSKKVFTVVSELSEIIIDEELGISYQAPLNWNEMPASLSEKMVGRVSKKGEDEFVIYKPKIFYYNKNNSSLLRIGEIKLKNNISSDSLSVDTYSVLFRKYNRDLEIKSSNITNSNFTIKQMKITKNNLMSFKYLFKNHNAEIIQFDFSIKKEDYAKIYPTIIASIETIKLL